jgi:hypothetical protein
MTQYQLDANVIAVKSILQEMANVSEQILQAGSDGNESAVRTGVDRMRQLNSEITSVEQKHKAYFDTRPKNEQLKIANLISTIKKSEDFRKAWMKRYHGIASNEVLLELPDGPGGILDMVIPESWDWRYDIVAFSDRSDSRFIKSILDRGQKRVIVYCSSFISEKDKILGATYLDDDKAIDAYLSNLSPNIPNQICIFDKIIQIKSNTEYKEKEQDENFETRIQKGFERAIVNRNTVRILGNKWINQAIENLPVIAHQPSFFHLSKIVTGMPLVIISPGPSLDKNIQYLKHIKDRAILLAPAQSIIALQKENIIPDIVMVSDPNDLLYLFDDYDMSKVYAVLTGVSCHPELFNRYKDKIISFNVNGPIDSWASDIFQDDSPKGACGSVSSMAFLLGGILRCDPIILVGQDLAFDGERQYSKGAADGEVTVAFDESNQTFSYSSANSGFEKIIKAMLGNNYKGSATTLPGYYGGTVTTKSDYAMFHAEFERIAAATKEFDSPLRLFNCTEGGAFIDGFEHIPLRQAIEKLNHENAPILNKDILFQSVFCSADKNARLKLLKNALTDINETLRASTTLAKQCHEFAIKIEKGQMDLTPLSAKEAELTMQIKTSNFISIAVQQEIGNVLRLNENATTLKQNLGASKLLYKLVMQETKKMQPYVTKSLDALEALLTDQHTLDSLVP